MYCKITYGMNFDRPVLLKWVSVRDRRYHLCQRSSADHERVPKICIMLRESLLILKNQRHISNGDTTDSHKIFERLFENVG